MFWNKKISNDIPEIKKNIDSIEEYIGSLEASVSTTRKEFEGYRKDVNNRINRLNNILQEKLDINKESTEELLIQLERTFEEKINGISQDKPLITNLLQKIAKLEGISDAIEHRRSSEEILGTLKVLNDKMLKDDREEKDVTTTREQIRILKWVLGENI